MKLKISFENQTKIQFNHNTTLLHGYIGLVKV